MRYEVSWVPTDKIIAAAKAAGMPEGDDCVLDYVEEGDHQYALVTPTFSRAVTLAKSKLGDDFFGQVRIERQYKVRCRYGPDRYDADAIWYVGADDEPNEDAPDHVPEMELLDDEWRVEE